MSPSITVPSGLSTLLLSFTHFVETEPRYDGGTLQLRVNDGPWFFVPALAFAFNPYNTSFFSTVQGNSNPLAGRVAFTGVEWGMGLFACRYRCVCVGGRRGATAI
ncbi:MAG: hypothetical protein IPK83_16615 [Planctomycetes bacterium]|nr:hypothetical protein [Planctomycetota bacterium]